jgi:hypothetical protein
MTRPPSGDFLTCPACEEPCTAIPPAEYLFVCLGKTEPVWNEDQEGTCDCGAKLRVSITEDWVDDDGDEDGAREISFAELVEVEAEVE